MSSSVQPKHEEQQSATRREVEELCVDVDYVRALLGGSTVVSGSVLEIACAEAGISELRRWYDTIGERLKETHLLPMMRRCCPDISDARIFDIFDLLDVESKGCLRFYDLHLLVCILAGRGEGKMKQFLYLRGKVSFTFLVGEAVVGEERPKNVACKRLFRFLNAFGFDQYVVGKLQDLHLASKKQLTESEVSLFLFAICQEYDQDFAQLSAGTNEKDKDNKSRPSDTSTAVTFEADISASSTSKSKLCTIS